MKRFAYRIAHALKTVFRNRWLWLAAAIALTGWFAIRQLAPEVTAVPVILPAAQP